MYPYEFPGIYRLLNTANGKSYVGQAQNIRVRIHEHRRCRNLLLVHPLYRGIIKHGWMAFEVSVLERVDDLDLLDARELHWIVTLKSSVKENGYNICTECVRNTRGRVRPAEERAIISAHAKQRVGDRNHFYGKRHSEESKRLISEKKKRQKLSPEHNRKLHEASGLKRRKPVKQIDRLTGEVIKIWECLWTTCRELGMNTSSIAQVFSGRAKTAGGYRWERL